jgi:hypothetical protein
MKLPALESSPLGDPDGHPTALAAWMAIFSSSGGVDTSYCWLLLRGDMTEGFNTLIARGGSAFVAGKPNPDRSQFSNVRVGGLFGVA